MALTTSEHVSHPWSLSDTPYSGKYLGKEEHWICCPKQTAAVFIHGCDRHLSRFGFWAIQTCIHLKQCISVYVCAHKLLNSAVTSNIGAKAYTEETLWHHTKPTLLREWPMTLELSL